MKTAPFYSLTVSFLAGILVCSFFHLPGVLAIPGAFLAGFGGIALAFGANGDMRIRTVAIIIGSISAFALGSWRIVAVNDGAHPLDGSVDKMVALTGTICDEPTSKGYQQKICFQPDGSSDRLLLTVSGISTYAYGDVISVTGKPELPKNFLSYEGGPEFDYISYLAKDDVRYIMNRPALARTGENHANRMLAWLYGIKDSFVAKMRRLVPDPESSILAALIVGDRSRIPQEVSDAFRSAGLIHVLVLSGFHVTIVAESLMKAFSFLPRLAGQSFGAASIVIFALMTGASATTIRATAMALVAIIARSSARRYSAARALVIAAVVMCAVNPRILVFDISFELSALATLALIVLSPIMNDWLERVRVPNRLKFREMLAVTLSAQIFTAPFIVYEMGQISAVAIASNPTVVPVTPYAMLLGFAATLAGFVNETLAGPIALGATMTTKYMISATSWFASMPFALIRMSAGVWTLALSYAVYTALLILFWRRRKRQTRPRRNSPRKSAN
ncbi:MAG: ComEC/Rec2 family competence protein [Patescibacteria group bacterium]|nr:ComEC/Rec2 family competence protein [Patescibacteria group bacterium]